MKKVTLRFKDNRDLRRFMLVLESSYIEMIAEDLTITCIDEEAEIELAVKGFNAQVVEVDSEI